MRELFDRERQACGFVVRRQAWSRLAVYILYNVWVWASPRCLRAGASWVRDAMSWLLPAFLTSPRPVMPNAQQLSSKSREQSEMGTGFVFVFVFSAWTKLRLETETRKPRIKTKKPRWENKRMRHNHVDRVIQSRETTYCKGSRSAVPWNHWARDSESHLRK